MRAGLRVYRVQFRRAAITADALGSTETWDDHGYPVWADKQDISDGERWRAGEVAAHISARFRVPVSGFVLGITPKDRMVCRGLTYDISGIKEIVRDRELEFTAAARVDL